MAHGTEMFPGSSGLGVTGWRKSTRSGPYSDNCVEMARVVRLTPAKSVEAADGITDARRREIEAALSGVALAEASTCFEGATVAVAIGDTKDRLGPKLAFGPADWMQFVGAVKLGSFDLAPQPQLQPVAVG